MMNLILTMAGNYTRFKNEGYTIPKYLFPWKDTYILNEIIKSLNRERTFDNIFLVANKRDENFMPHVKSILKLYRQLEKNLFLISDTKGQAETAFNAVKKIQENTDIEGPIIFHNIDTILYNRDFSDVPRLLKRYDGYIDIFNSNNHEYSYVRVDDNGFLLTIEEKILISEKATSGLYGFSSINKFLEFYSNDDIYISNIYKKMIDKKQKIVISREYDENETIVLGTPNEYFNATNKFIQ